MYNNDLDNIKSDTTLIMGNIIETGAYNYTTNSWARGLGGPNYQVTTNGYYYIEALFGATIEGTLSTCQFHIQTLPKNGSTLDYTSRVIDSDNAIWDSATMRMKQISCICKLPAYTWISTYIHTPDAGITLPIALRILKLQSYNGL